MNYKHFIYLIIFRFFVGCDQYINNKKNLIIKKFSEKEDI